jgi:hypothetical protein
MKDKTQENLESDLLSPDKIRLHLTKRESLSSPSTIKSLVVSFAYRAKLDLLIRNQIITIYWENPIICNKYRRECLSIWTRLQFLCHKLQWSHKSWVLLVLSWKRDQPHRQRRQVQHLHGRSRTDQSGWLHLGNFFLNNRCENSSWRTKETRLRDWYWESSISSFYYTCKKQKRRSIQSKFPLFQRACKTSTQRKPIL